MVNEFSNDIVPGSSRVGLIRVTLINIGMMATLSQFMLGATLGHGMRFTDAMVSTFIGSIILSLIGTGIGIIGTREGITTSLLLRRYGFGKKGSTIVSVALVISLLGWFGIQNSVFASALNYLSDDRLGSTLSAFISGLILTIMVSFGFRSIGLTAVISVPLFLLVTGFIVVKILPGTLISDLRSLHPGNERISLFEGITIVVGGYITGVLTMPDVTRYCKNGKHVLWMILISLVIGETVINGTAVLIAQTLGTADIVTIMTDVAGGIGLTCVLLSTIKINNTNLYSSSLSMACVIENVSGRKPSYILLTMIAGVSGTLLSVSGILDKFTDFLSVMGIIFPSVTGILLCDYYIISRSYDKKQPEKAKYDVSEPCWPALISSAAGIISSTYLQWGIRSINSLLIASVCYYIIMVYKFAHDK